MSISIRHYQLPDQVQQDLYEVTFFDEQIRTVVTHTPSVVDSWISDIRKTHNNRLDLLLLGLDINSISSGMVATLQLCADDRCLIFQIIHAPTVPQSLVDLLRNDGCTFVGVGIENDANRLLDDYGVEVLNTVDLSHLAADMLGVKELRSAGLKGLAKAVLGKEVKKHKEIAFSKWDSQKLTSTQVQFASVDAFLALEIGKALDARV